MFCMHYIAYIAYVLHALDCELFSVYQKLVGNALAYDLKQYKSRYTTPELGMVRQGQ